MKSSRGQSGEGVSEAPDVSHIKNVDVTHEKSDVNVRAVLIFVGGLVVFAAIIHLLIGLMFKGLDDRAAKLEPKPGPMAMSAQEQRPPEPRLQNAPGFGVTLENGQRVSLELKEPQAEMKVLRDQWDQALKRGPVDQSGKVVGLPIEEAKKQIVQKSLSARPQQGGPNAVDYGVDMPTYSSSGRMTEKRDQ